MFGHLSRLSGFAMAITGLGLAYLSYDLVWYVDTPEARSELALAALANPCLDQAAFRLHHIGAHGLSTLGSFVLGLLGLVLLLGERRAWAAVGITTIALILIPLVVRPLADRAAFFWDYSLKTYLLLLLLLLFAALMHRVTKRHA